jgi:L-iditol 2-dehydrogenase
VSDNAGPSLPKTMRASVLLEVGKVAVLERPVPRPGPGEVLVRISSVGVCGSDVHYYQHGRIGDYVVDGPLVLGHEAGGRIVAVGPGVSAARVDERVAVEPGLPCRRCELCRSGRYNLCRDVRFLATPPIDGAFCEFLVVAADFAFAVPDSVSDDAAALIEPLSVGLWACQKAGVGAGSRVLVTGAGPIGLIVLQVARALGAGWIRVSDIDQQRRETALRYGASEVVDPTIVGESEQTPVDCFIDCSGAAAAVKAGIREVSPGGSVVLVGMGSDEVILPIPFIQNRELTVTGTFRYANTYPAAVSLAASGVVDLDGLVTRHVDLDHVADALSPERSSKDIKIIVRPA